MHIIYQTTCLVNGKKYIGVHNGTNPDYLGSGAALKKAVKRYGRKNFVRETLFEFATAAEAYAKEAEVITEDILLSEEYYNISYGGNCPPNPKGRRINDTSAYSAANKKKWGDPEYKKRVSETMKQNWNRSEGRLEKLRTQNIGRKLSEEHLAALREGHKKAQRKVYMITNGEETHTSTLYDFCAMKELNPKSAIQCVWKRGSYKGWAFTEATK
jgi:hypothetical protein